MQSVLPFYKCKSALNTKFLFDLDYVNEVKQALAVMLNIMKFVNVGNVRNEHHTSLKQNMVFKR